MQTFKTSSLLRIIRNNLSSKAEATQVSMRTMAREIPLNIEVYVLRSQSLRFNCHTCWIRFQYLIHKLSSSNKQWHFEDLVDHKL